MQQGKIDLRVNNSRPRIGETRRLSLTLPPETWEKVDNLIKQGRAKKLSEAIRIIIQEWR